MSPTPGSAPAPARRLRDLDLVEVAGSVIPVADRFGSRLLGLAALDRSQAGPGLLIPRCRSVHTFGMRFPLDIHFLDAAGRVLESRIRIPPGRLVSCRQAAAVLELVSPGGETDDLGA